MLPFTRVLSDQCEYSGMKVIPFVIHSCGDSVLVDTPIVNCTHCCAIVITTKPLTHAMAYVRTTID